MQGTRDLATEQDGSVATPAALTSPPATAVVPRLTAADRQKARRNPMALVGTEDLFVTQREQDIYRAGQAMFAAFAQHRSTTKGPLRDGRKLSDRSLATYREMWEPFITFCALHHIDASAVTATDLTRYLDRRSTRTAPRKLARDRATRGPDEEASVLFAEQRRKSRDRTANTRPTSVDISARHGFRILALIDKVLRLHASDTKADVNLAPSQLLQTAPYVTVNAKVDEAASPPVLKGRQISDLKTVCTRRLNSGDTGPQSWVDIRDNAAVLLQLATGISPLEVRGLKLRHVVLGARSLPEALALDKNDTYGPREVPIAFSEAATLLDYWFDVRDIEGIQGDYVFPSKRRGTQWSEISLIKKTKAVFDRAGLGHLPGAGYRLRHTYIARRLKLEKLPPEKVAALAGIQQVDEMVARYKNAQVD